MPRTTFEKWLAALRSGNTKQGQGYLCSIDGNSEMCFCTLGLLLDVMELPKEQELDGNIFCFTFDSRFSDLTEAIQKSTGLSRVGKLPYPVMQAGYKTPSHELTTLNDRGMSFAEIASVVEAQFDPTDDALVDA